MQGFNMGRYIPPASEDPALASGKVGGFNSQKSHPLGSRFSKAKDGLITVRFEMPFDVWCHTCKPEFLIKQGVRFNAEKSKVGSYLSSPIWEFKFRHPPCSGFVAIRTDPEKTQYVVSLGGRKKAGAPTTALDRDYGEILTEEERERRRNDAFANLEGVNEDKAQERTDSLQLRWLYQSNGQHWEDPYTANQRLRRGIRVGRKQREAAAQDKAEVSERYGLAIDLLDHSQEDADRAALIDYGVVNDSTVEKTLAKPVFAARSPRTAQIKADAPTKSKRVQQQAASSFQRAVISNTKAKVNPFGDQSPDWSCRGKVAAAPEMPLGDIISKRQASVSPEHSPRSSKLVAYEDSEDSEDEAPD